MQSWLAKHRLPSCSGADHRDSGILESGAIPHRKIGRHRRILMKDVLAYKKTMQVNRRAALDELVKASEDAGGYDL
jgi:hypothetical protein